VRRAVVRTDHGDAATARRVAAAVGPDNTAEMETRTEGATVVTTVRRETTGGLHSTLDDYVVNLGVAARLADRSADATGDGAVTDADAETDVEVGTATDTDTDADADTHTDTDTERDTDT
jgi:hypothetical protein